MRETRRKHGPGLSRQMDRYLAAMARTQAPRIARLRSALAEDGGRPLKAPLRTEPR